jgi:hypothetical protein
MDETPTSPEEIAVEPEHRRTAEALARAVREAAAELLPFGLEPQDFTATLERLAEPAPVAGERP